MTDKHGKHYERPIVKVHLWDSVIAYRGWRMQFFDAMDSYPHCYEPTEDDLNRLMRAVRGWNCQIKDGVWEWTRTPQVTVLPDERLKAAAAMIARLEQALYHADDCQGCEYCDRKETNE